MGINDEDDYGSDLGINWMTNEQIENTEKNSLLITSSNAFDLLVVALDHYQRDYDILMEPLGIVKTTSCMQRIKSSDVIFCR